MFPNFDPSKMDPKVMMELSQLIQSLPSNQLMRMQTLMHKAMAGLDVRREMEEFERALPPGFRDRITSLVASNPNAFAPAMGSPASSTQVAAEPASSSEHSPLPNMDLREARLTILRGVAAGQLAPEEAERLLFTAT